MHRSVFVFATVIVFLPITVRSQTAASIGMKGGVSQTVILSMSPTVRTDNVQSETVAEGNNLRVLLSGNSDGPKVIRIPLLVRSNIGYRITATIESQSVVVNQLSVTDARATGRFVAPEAMKVTVAPLDLSKNLLILSGPRVSLAGTLNSPNNALEVFLLIRVTPEKEAGSWQLSLILTSAADN